MLWEDTCARPSQHPQGRAGRATGDAQGHYPPPSQVRPVGGSSAWQRSGPASDVAGGALDRKAFSECHTQGGGHGSIPTQGCHGVLAWAGSGHRRHSESRGPWPWELASRVSPGLEPGLGAPAAPGCGGRMCGPTGRRSPALGLHLSVPFGRWPLPSKGATLTRIRTQRRPYPEAHQGQECPAAPPEPASLRPHRCLSQDLPCPGPTSKQPLPPGTRLGSAGAPGPTVGAGGRAGNPCPHPGRGNVSGSLARGCGNRSSRSLAVPEQAGLDLPGAIGRGRERPQPVTLSPCSQALTEACGLIPGQPRAGRPVPGPRHEPRGPPQGPGGHRWREA